MAGSYLDSDIRFKIRKVYRYFSLYGVSRTLAKVRAQMHLAREFDMPGETWPNPGCRNTDDADRAIAILGCGNFSHSAIGYYLSRRSRHFLRATFDSNPSRAISLCKDFGGAYAARNIESILDDSQVRLVFIASNHASHADYAIRCIEAGKHVHIEKPHVVSEEQLTRLLDAMAKQPDIKVYLGFNRPRSPHFREIANALSAQQGPTMINWFIAGHEIPEDHWYFREEEGGRILGNVCHWTDLTLEMIGTEGAFPCTIIPASPKETKSDFCFAIRFADASVAAVTFSAKGHTFEGVREVLQAHRGDALVRMKDFEETTIEIVERRRTFRTRHRHHGHKQNILNSYNDVISGRFETSVDPAHLELTARLFLGVKKAIDGQVEVRCEPL